MHSKTRTYCLLIHLLLATLTLSRQESSKYRFAPWTASDIVGYINTLHVTETTLVDPNHMVNVKTIESFNLKLQMYQKSLFILIEKISKEYIDSKTAKVDSQMFISELRARLARTDFEDYVLVLFSIEDEVYMYLRTRTHITYLEDIKLSYAIKKTKKYLNNEMYDQAFLELADNLSIIPHIIDIGIPTLFFALFMFMLILHCTYENTISAKTTKNRASLKRKLLRLTSIANNEVNFSHIEEVMCTICMLQLLNKPGAEIEFLACDHRFHHKCISKWYAEFAYCPMCMALENRGTANHDFLERLIEVQKRKYAGKIGAGEVQGMFDLIKIPGGQSLSKTVSLKNIRINSP